MKIKHLLLAILITNSINLFSMGSNFSDSYDQKPLRIKRKECKLRDRIQEEKKINIFGVFLFSRLHGTFNKSDKTAELKNKRGKLISVFTKIISFYDISNEEILSRYKEKIEKEQLCLFATYPNPKYDTEVNHPDCKNVRLWGMLNDDEKYARIYERRIMRKIENPVSKPIDI